MDINKAALRAKNGFGKLKLRQSHTDTNNARTLFSLFNAVAQSDRAPDLRTGGCGFESRQQRNPRQYRVSLPVGFVNTTESEAVYAKSKK